MSSCFAARPEYFQHRSRRERFTAAFSFNSLYGMIINTSTPKKADQLMKEYETYGLLGEAVSKSLSPQIYNELFTQLDVPAVYMPFPVPEDQFLAALPVLRSTFAGFNVATPYRLDIMAHLDSEDATAKQAGAANTIVVKKQKMIGYNTDMKGFDRSLIGFMGNMYDKDVLLIGAGGAAHAVANVLLEKGAFLTIISRNSARAVMLQNACRSGITRTGFAWSKGCRIRMRFSR